MPAARRHVAILAALLAGGTGPALAQAPDALGPPALTPSNRPVTSPYLSLSVDAGSIDSAAFQYFRRIRPEMEFRRSNARLGSEIRSVERQLGYQQSMAQSPASALGSTGHPTAFQSFGNFFPSRGR